MWPSIAVDIGKVTSAAIADHPCSADAALLVPTAAEKASELSQALQQECYTSLWLQSIYNRTPALAERQMVPTVMLWSSNSTADFDPV